MSEKIEKKSIATKTSDSLRGYKSEFKKIVWPSWKTIVKNTGIVVAFILLLGAFIALVDFGFSALLKWVLSFKG